MKKEIPLNSKRAQEIKTYISEHPNCKKGLFPLVIKGKRSDQPVYTLPIHLLRYNVFNGRFTAERLSLQTELGRELNSDDKEDADTIRNILNGVHPKIIAENLTPEKAETLKKSLKESGQLQPGLITSDGYVINGNRRMAVIEALNKEQPSGKWETLDVMILPDDIAEKDLYRVEVGLQMSEELKLDYGPINRLLKLREGLAFGLTKSEVVAAMFGWEEKDLDEALERLQLIDGFLSYIEEENNYKKVEGMHEYFIDLQTHVLKPAINDGVSKKEIANRINNSYELLRVKLDPTLDKDSFSHWKFRTLKGVFSDRNAYQTFSRTINEHEPMSVAPRLILDDFKDAVDVVALKEERNEPLKLISKAQRSLDGINYKSEHFNKREVKTALEHLEKTILELKKKIKV